MDSNSAVFQVLDPFRTLVFALVFHVLSRVRARSLGLRNSCPKYVAQTGLWILYIGHGSLRGQQGRRGKLAVGGGCGAPGWTRAGDLGLLCVQLLAGRLREARRVIQCLLPHGSMFHPQPSASQCRRRDRLLNVAHDRQISVDADLHIVNSRKRRRRR